MDEKIEYMSTNQMTEILMEAKRSLREASLAYGEVVSDDTATEFRNAEDLYHTLRTAIGHALADRLLIR